MLVASHSTDDALTTGLCAGHGIGFAAPSNQQRVGPTRIVADSIDSLAREPGRPRNCGDYGDTLLNSYTLPNVLWRVWCAHFVAPGYEPGKGISVASIRSVLGWLELSLLIFRIRAKVAGRRSPSVYANEARRQRGGRSPSSN